jgi:peroxiredoxin
MAPKVGEQAPDFELTYVAEPDKTVRLSSFIGKKPVALIFGSCT